MVSRTKITALGALLGAGLGYLTGLIIVDHLTPISFEELDQLDDPYGGHMEDEQLEPKEPVIVKGHRENSKKIGVVRNYTEYFNQQGRPDLAALAAKYNSKEPAAGVEALVDEATAPDGMDVELDVIAQYEEQEKPIRIISQDEYMNSDTGFEKTVIHYFDDDVVADESGEPFSNPEGFLGEDALVSFGQLSGDPDIVYVRNSDLEGEYEIVRMNKSYAPELPQKGRRLKNHDGDFEES